MNKLSVSKKRSVKFILVLLATLAICLVSFSPIVNASVSEIGEIGDGGDIADSTLFSNGYTLIGDIAGTLQWVIPIAGVAMILWYVFRIMTGDEQDQQRYKKGLVKIIICVIVAEVVVSLINVIIGYFN